MLRNHCLTRQRSPSPFTSFPRKRESCNNGALPDPRHHLRHSRASGNFVPVARYQIPVTIYVIPAQAGILQQWRVTRSPSPFTSFPRKREFCNNGALPDPRHHLRHSRASGNFATMARYQIPVTIYVIPAQAGILQQWRVTRSPSPFTSFPRKRESCNNGALPDPRFRGDDSSKGRG